MTRRYWLAALLALLVSSAALANGGPALDPAVGPAVGPAPGPAPGSVARRPVLLTGEVEAADSQPVFVPASNSSPLVLRNFVADGNSVKAGDVVLRIETGGAANVDRLKIELEQNRAKVERETAEMEVGALDTEKELLKARAAYAKAKIDAALPKIQIAALNFDRYQAELDRATRDLAMRQQVFDNYHGAVERSRQDGELTVKKMQINLAFQVAQLRQSEVLAEHDGVVVHGYSPWRGERFEEGSTAWPGNTAGLVLGDGRSSVTVWALEADRAYLALGQSLQLRFDALPGAIVTGRIEQITGAPEARAAWGRGRYFRVKVGLPEHHGLALVPGMSVLAEPLATQPARLAATSAASGAAARQPDALTLEGEIAARLSTPVSPPSIPYVWQYKLASLAPEGAMVEAGQTVAQFESTEVTNQLASQQSALKEKQRALDKLRLDQSEADHAGDMAVLEAQSNAEKAERKASQPRELIRRVDYDKLVIERALNADLARLAQRLRLVQGQARHAARSGLEAEAAQLQGYIATLLKGRAAMTVKASKRGLVLYKVNFNGDKFTAGSDVWMGLSVATLADPGSLYISARVPEAQASRVRLGQVARISVSGANQQVAAHVVALGRAFHGKSASQSVVVRDVELQFDDAPKGLKPGAAVQATLTAGPAGPAAPAGARLAAAAQGGQR